MTVVRKTLKNGKHFQLPDFKPVRGGSTVDLTDRRKGLFVLSVLLLSAAWHGLMIGRNGAGESDGHSRETGLLKE